MANMLPPRMLMDPPSQAERRLFEVIKSDLPADWTALYSVGLCTHPDKPWAEIDFILVGPPGVFCLEVKGGRVTRGEGWWTFTNRLGKETRKNQGPFEQVGSATGALRRYLVDSLPTLGGIVVGYGVLMPDIRFSAVGPDVEPEVVYDERDGSAPFDVYMKRLAHYWHDRIGKRQGRPIALPSARDRSTVINLLRPDFDLRPSLRAQVGHAREELLRLTNEQYKVLDGLSCNPRVLVRGGAGTGKTVLAIQEALDMAEAGQKVLFCCYNKGLAVFLREVLQGRPRITVEHLHGLMGELIREAGLTHRLPNAQEQDLFALFYPQVCLEALDALKRWESYDALIVDEAQDLLLEGYVDVFDALLKGNLAGGKWRFFLDPFQNLYGATAPPELERLMSAYPAQYRLSVNCRNTAPIGVATAILSGADTDNTLIAEGPEVEQYWYNNKAEERREVSKCVLRLLSGGIKPKDIVLLSRYRRDNICLQEGLIGVPFPLADTDAQTAKTRRESIRFSTVAGFKGLESDAAILMDVDDLIHKDALMSVYVGTSRPRAFLAVFIHEKLRDIYDRHALEYGMRLAGRAGRAGSLFSY